MKKFEKHNKTQGIDFRIRFSSVPQFGAYVKQERENTWRAALEWAYSHKTDIGYAGEAVPINIIEKELNEN